MSQNNKKNSFKIMEYYDWVGLQGFKNPKEHHEYVSQQEQDFLKNVIYPMFYDGSTPSKTPCQFPLVLKGYSTRKPKYVIDNNYFTIVFFSYDNYDHEMCWEVSVHIKDHEFCDERINEFKNWYLKHYNRIFAEMENMPKDFLYPKLDLYSSNVQDFCIEFWNSPRDFMLFKLMDILRLF